jgi:beta-lactam-binding protein with PASTA domain
LGGLPLRRVKGVPIVGRMLDRGEHPHSRTSRIAAVIAIAGTLCLVVSGSSAAGQAVVPDVVGLNVVSAYYDVRDAGFAVQIDEPIEIGAMVSHQSSPPGSKGREGAPVVLDLDTGPHGLLPNGGWTPRMPRLVGKPLPDAIQTLQALGLLWSVARLPALPATLRPSLFDNYRVIAQSPKPGTRFTQTVVRETAQGTLTETTTVGLMTELRLK